MVSIQVSSSPSVNTHYVNVGQNNGAHNNVHNIVIVNDQSVLKGLLWGFVGFKFGSATLGCIGGTLVSAPLIVTPLLVVPIGLGVASCVLGSITSTCLDNTLYHLGSRQVKVLQVS